VSVPKSFVMTMSTCPAITPAGVSHVMLVELAITMFVALTPPKVTAVAPTDVKSVPVMVTGVPPARAPSAGSIEMMSGAL